MSIQLDRVPEWQRNVPCQGLTHIFFPTRGASSKTTARAVAICNTCPHTEPCLELGLPYPQAAHGIFGGKTPAQRQAIRLSRKGAA